MSAETAPYLAAFDDLSPYRPKTSTSLGLGGGVTFPDPIPRDMIREEGRQLHYRGEDLDDFCTIVRGFDRAYLNVEHARIAGRVNSSVDKKGR